MSGGRRPYEKGRRMERELAALLGGERVPLSGAAGGAYAGDVMAMGLRWQVKVEADGWRRLYRWLDAADALALKADHRPWLVVMTLETFLRLAKGVTADAAATDGGPRRRAGGQLVGGGAGGPAAAGPIGPTPMPIYGANPNNVNTAQRDPNTPTPLASGPDQLENGGA